MRAITFWTGCCSCRCKPRNSGRRIRRRIRRRSPERSETHRVDRTGENSTLSGQTLSPMALIV